ncbi:MAG TPA: AMP-binding protein [Terriglobales bacterium]|nr:AMP-binding protein [Terriglobales bacterium]
MRFPYSTLPEALLAADDNAQFVTMWRAEDDFETITFRQFKRLAAGQAAYLKENGVGLRDTVVLVQPQGIDVMATFAGAMLLGAVPAILAYPTFKIDPEKYRFGLNGVTSNLKAKAVVVDEHFPGELLSNLWQGENTRLLRSARVEAQDSHFRNAQIKPDETAFIQHSAGTTGLQKGVALSHAAVLRHLNRLAEVLRLTPSDSIYSWLPLYHDMGLIACFMLPMVSHLPVAMQSPTEWVIQPKSMLEVITKFKSTLAWLPNFTYQFTARRADEYDEKDFDLSSIRALINCSEPVRGSSMDEFRKAFQKCKLPPNTLHSCYAMAETVFAVSQSDLAQGREPVRIAADPEKFRKEHRIESGSSGKGVEFVSSGRLIPGTHVRIVSDDGSDLAEGQVGEVAIRSDAMLNGYYNRPDLTEKAVRNGWYFSGDLGFLLNGELFVVGRKKDLIIVGGENIYPQDVEEIVSAHPAIHDGRVIALGLYNTRLGTEEIVVIAEVRDEKFLAESAEIERALSNEIVGELSVAAKRIYLKPPKWIVKSTAGKPARSTSREKLLREHPELQDLTGETFDDERSSTATH